MILFMTFKSKTWHIMQLTTKSFCYMFKGERNLKMYCALKKELYNEIWHKFDQIGGKVSKL